MNFERWVVASSSHVDQTSLLREWGGEGYWILHSTDGGRSWDRALYTGLREREPYVVVPASKEPLVQGGRVRLAVNRLVSQTSEASVFVPLVIESTIEKLRLDSDGDGLTDLLEFRMLTDPRAADTDGDGIPDGVDPFPTIAKDLAAPSDRAVLLGELLSIPASRPDGGLDDSFGFVVGERSDFTSATANERSVVVTEAEFVAICKQRGPMLLITVSVTIDAAHQHALCILNSDTGGTSYEATKTGGRWTLGKKQDWYR